MADAVFTSRDEPALGPGARVYRVVCAHGVSSAAMLPGRRPASELLVLDVLLAGHHPAHGCRCLPSAPLGGPLEGRA